MILPLILFCAFIALVAESTQVEVYPWGLALCAMGVVSAAFGIAAFLSWWDERRLRGERIRGQIEREAKVSPLQAQTALVDKVLQLSPEQRKMIMSYQAVITVIAGMGRASRELTVCGVTKKWEVAEEFLDQCTETRLAPVRWWGDGSDVQIMGRAITKHVVDCGYAAEAVGNQPARWIDRDSGLRSIGIILRDGRMEFGD